MSINHDEIPTRTIVTLVRSFFKEAHQYGFKQKDFLKFVNELLDLAMQTNGMYADSHRKKPSYNSEKAKSTKLPLLGQHVKVRAFYPKIDMPVFIKWLEDPDGRYFLLSRISMRRTRLQDLIRDSSNCLGVITLKDDTPIGGLGFLKHDPKQHKAELRKIIGESRYRGKGYAKEATRMWIHYGWYGMGLKKIYLNTLETNLRNIKLNEELGFKIEGLFHNEVIIDGQYHDVIRMGMWVED